MLVNRPSWPLISSRRPSFDRRPHRFNSTFSVRVFHFILINLFSIKLNFSNWKSSLNSLVRLNTNEKKLSNFFFWQCHYYSSSVKISDSMAAAATTDPKPIVPNCMLEFKFRPSCLHFFSSCCTRRRLSESSSLLGYSRAQS